MNKESVDLFEKIAAQLSGLYEEMSVLSKKNPNDAVNKFKLRFINQQIAECNGFLEDRYRPFNEFENFKEDDIPQNSDVVFILSQYLQCLEKLRSDNAVQRAGSWYWQVKGEEDDKIDKEGFIYIRTSQPKRLRG
ncbi:MAG: hypothetical protein Q8L64_01340 [bacterium]|nr:hypothetical protein [bacterium]